MVDVKPLDHWYQVHRRCREHPADLAEQRGACPSAARGCDHVFNLAADMGGMGFIENNKAAVHAQSVLINTHLLMAATDDGVERFFFASSACVYAADKQTDPNVTALKEADAYPAMPEDGYGWEKLFSERMCRHFREDFGLDDPRRPLPQRLRPARHLDGWAREGAGRDLPQDRRGQDDAAATRSRSGATASRPAASCTSTTACTAPQSIMDSDIVEPINLGSERARDHQPAGRHRRATSPASSVERRHDLTAPQGVRGRNSDNTMILAELGWEPGIRLQTGLEKTYEWIYDQVASR